MLSEPHVTSEKLEFQRFSRQNITNSIKTKVKSQFIWILYFSDYRELLANDKIDAFALAVKNDVGQKIAEDILTAGKHLFIEKPLAKSVEDAITLKKLAEKNLYKKVLKNACFL